MSTDVFTSFGVFGGLLLIQITKLQILDPIVAIGVAALIMKVAYDLTREAGRPLVDHQLPDGEVERVNEILHADKRIIGYHKLRTRRAGSHRHIDVHLIVPQQLSITKAHEVAEEIEDRIREELGGVQVVTHIEPNTEKKLDETPPEGFTENNPNTCDDGGKPV